MISLVNLERETLISCEQRPTKGEHPQGERAQLICQPCCDGIEVRLTVFLSYRLGRAIIGSWHELDLYCGSSTSSSCFDDSSSAVGPHSRPEAISESVSF